MPADASFAQRGSFVRTDNKVNVGVDGSPFAAYDATLAGVEYFYADARGKFVKDKSLATQQRVKLSWTLDGSPIALRDDIPVKFHGKSLYAARCREIAGVRDEAGIAGVDLAQFVGFKGIVDTESLEKPAKDDKPSYFWTNVKDVRSRERRVARPPGTQAAPAASAAPVVDAATAQPPQATEQRQADPKMVVARLLNAVPATVAKDINALADWAKLSPAQLAIKIAYFSGNEPLSIDDVAKLKEKIRAERAA